MRDQIMIKQFLDKTLTVYNILKAQQFPKFKVVVRGNAPWTYSPNDYDRSALSS